MGSSSCLLLITFLLVFLQTDSVLGGCYTSIISFGDSIADTGNRISYDNKSNFRYLPYGENFLSSGFPTGRASDGRLIIDFIAQAVGLPYVPPYLGHASQDFRKGVNFAVAGATALDVGFFDKMGVSLESNCSLAIQLRWFKQLLPSLCRSPSECRNMLGNALFLMGEIGGNDYNEPLLQGRGLEEVQTIVPKVIDLISSTITALINEGAVTVMVPGNFPIGCSAIYLTMYASKIKNDYDTSGCLKWLNEFSRFHNHQLQGELNRLRRIHPHATIIYVDYYNAAMSLYRFPNELGFSRGALKACCGGGGPYNFNASAICTFPGSKACDDPWQYVCWDGLHLTEAAYKTIATRILEGPFTIPPINISCVPSINPPLTGHPYSWK